MIDMQGFLIGRTRNKWTALGVLKRDELIANGVNPVEAVRQTVLYLRAEFDAHLSDMREAVRGRPE
jgi:hypothetical protein